MNIWLRFLPSKLEITANPKPKLLSIVKLPILADCMVIMLALHFQNRTQHTKAASHRIRYRLTVRQR